jgi:hypothetical protein
MRQRRGIEQATTMSENQIVTNRHYYAHFSLFYAQQKITHITIHE